MYEFYNPNPKGKSVGDCTVRALTKALDMTWDDVYAMLVLQGYKECDMPSSNAVWGKCLLERGCRKNVANGETFEEFCVNHPKGTYLVCTGSHVACCKNGILYDSWDSCMEIVIFYYKGV